MSPWWLAAPFLGVIVCYFYRHRSLGLALIIAGGLNNLLDVVRVGYVIDDLHIHNLFFNLADVMIILGAIFTIISVDKSIKKPIQNLSTD